MTRLQVDIDPDLKDRLKIRAIKEGKNLSTLVCDVLSDFMHGYEETPGAIVPTTATTKGKK